MYYNTLSQDPSYISPPIEAKIRDTQANKKSKQFDERALQSIETVLGRRL